jgi:hypothetical protein
MENYVKREVDDYGNIRYFNSKRVLHRTDGPAFEYKNGSRVWYINGKYHRLDGPAAEWANGQKFWYILNKHMLKYKHNRLVLFSALEPKRVDLSILDF